MLYSPMHMLMGWHLNVYHLPIHSLIHLLSIYFSICRSLFLHSNWGMPHLHQAPEWPKKSHFVLLWSMWLDKIPFVWESFAPDSLPAPMTYDHRSTLRAPNCGLNGLKPAKRIGMDRLCYAVCLPNQVRNFWFLGHTHWNHWKQHQTTAAQSLATVPLALNSAVLVLWRGTA